MPNDPIENIFNRIFGGIQAAKDWLSKSVYRIGLVAAVVIGGGPIGLLLIFGVY